MNTIAELEQETGARLEIQEPTEEALVSLEVDLAVLRTVERRLGTPAEREADVKAAHEVTHRIKQRLSLIELNRGLERLGISFVRSKASPAGSIGSVAWNQG